MAQLVCEECGRIVDANASRCSYCGCPIEMMASNNEIHKQNTTTKFCKNCGQAVSDKVSYCPHESVK